MRGLLKIGDALWLSLSELNVRSSSPGRPPRFHFGLEKSNFLTVVRLHDPIEALFSEFQMRKSFKEKAIKEYEKELQKLQEEQEKAGKGMVEDYEISPPDYDDPHALKLDHKLRADMSLEFAEIGVYFISQTSSYHSLGYKWRQGQHDCFAPRDGAVEDRGRR